MKNLLLAALSIVAVGCHGDVTEYGQHVRTVHCVGDAFGHSAEYRCNQWTLHKECDAYLRPGGDNAAQVYIPVDGEGVARWGDWVLAPVENPLRLIVWRGQERAFVKTCAEGILPPDPLPEGTIDCSVPGNCRSE